MTLGFFADALMESDYGNPSLHGERVIATRLTRPAW